MQTPFFLNAFQFDTFQLTEDLYGTDSNTIHVASTAQVPAARIAPSPCAGTACRPRQSTLVR